MRTFTIYFFLLLNFCHMLTVCIAATNEMDQKSGVLSESKNLLKEPVEHHIYGAVAMKFAPVGPDGTNSLIVGGRLAGLRKPSFMKSSRRKLQPSKMITKMGKIVLRMSSIK